ncbi:MAG: hypothetical protein ACKVJU_18045 [Verrucomicrobiales bacterium]
MSESESAPIKKNSTNSPYKGWIIGSIVVWLAAAAIYLAVRPLVFEAIALFQIQSSSHSQETDLFTTAEKLRRFPIHERALAELPEAFPKTETFMAATAARVIPRTKLIRLTVRHENVDHARTLLSLLISEFKKTEKPPTGITLVFVDQIYTRGPANPSSVLVILAALACGITCGIGIAWLRQST